jgi:hypothetical protein
VEEPFLCETERSYEFVCIEWPLYLVLHV